MSPLLAALVAAPFVAGLVAGVPDEIADTFQGEEVVFAFTDPEIIESSGLVVREGRFVTMNDSGDVARVFTVDDRGDTVGETTWDGEAFDVEALAPARRGTDVWVGDIGDNLAQRDTITITRVPTGPGAPSGALESYDLVYPDRARDAETLLVHPRTGRVFVVSKDVVGHVYAAPRELGDGANELTDIGDVMGVATDGSFFPDGRHLILRGYASAAVYAWPSLDVVGEFDLPGQIQGEGLGVAEDGTVYLSSEGDGAEVLRVPLPEQIRDALAPEEPEAGEGTDAAGDEPVGTDGTTDEQSDGSDDTEAVVRELAPWALGGVALLLIVVVLLRSLRPR